MKVECFGTNRKEGNEMATTRTEHVQRLKIGLSAFRRWFVEYVLNDRDRVGSDVSNIMEILSGDIVRILAFDDSIIERVIEIPEVKELERLLTELRGLRNRLPPAVLVGQADVLAKLNRIKESISVCCQKAEGQLPMGVEGIEALKRRLAKFSEVLKGEARLCVAEEQKDLRSVIREVVELSRRFLRKDDNSLAGALRMETGDRILRQADLVLLKISRGHHVCNAISAKRLEALRDLLEDALDSIGDKVADVLSSAQKIAELRRDAEVNAEKAKEGVALVKKATGEAGAGKCSEHFDGEQKLAAGRAKGWLIAMVVMVLITAVALVCFYIWGEPTVKVPVSYLPTLICRAVIIGFLVTLTFWCGRMYRVMMNSVMQNKHRALCLQTFEALANAAQSPAVKDMVLREATKVIFEMMPTGLLGVKIAEGGDSNVVNLCGEAIKGIAAKESA